MIGNVLTGETVISSPGANSFMRVMHMSFGWPFTSALHEPHFPALQFQRTARSGAFSAWMRCTTSRTTMPSSAVTVYGMKSPPEASPRHTQTWTSGTARPPGSDRCLGAGRRQAGRFVLAQKRAELGWNLGDRLGREGQTTVALSRDDVLRPPHRVRLREVLAGVAAAAF